MFILSLNSFRCSPRGLLKEKTGTGGSQRGKNTDVFEERQNPANTYSVEEVEFEDPGGWGQYLY